MAKAAAISSGAGPMRGMAVALLGKLPVSTARGFSPGSTLWASASFLSGNWVASVVPFWTAAAAFFASASASAAARCRFTSTWAMSFETEARGFSSAGFFSSTWRRCQPKGVSTGSESSPTLRLNAAWANAGTKELRSFHPSSPPWPLLPGSSEDSFATSAKSFPSWICLRSAIALSWAAALSASLGVRDIRTRMWRTRTCSPLE